MFKTDRSLLNPKFEGYKLDPIIQENAVFRFRLEHKPTQVAVSGKSPLSFQEVQSRITHNHLAVSNQGGRALYIDANLNVVLVEVNIETLQPSFTVVYELPKPILSTTIEHAHREYPSAVFATPTTVLVSDGYGSMYVIDIPKTGPVETFGPLELSDAEGLTPGSAIPFRIHHVTKVSPDVAVAVISSRYYKAGELTADPSPDSQTSSRTRKHHPVEFDVWSVRFDLPLHNPPATEVGGKLDIVWRRRGDDVPIYATYDHTRSAHLLVGSSTYREIGTAPPLVYNPSPEELAPIPRADEYLDDKTDVDTAKPPPYSWTQTSDSVTVAFPLPSNTSKSDIKVMLTSRTLTLHAQVNGPSFITLPHYSLKLFWDGILPISSYWTWDREAEHAFGLLTLHLDKQNEGTKWMQVFAAATVAGQPTSEDVDIPETLDPSELWHIRESLEKYTTSLRDGEDASGLGLGKGVPGLAEGELDDEVDASIGREAYLTWVEGSEASAAWASTAKDVPFVLLSTVIPGLDSQDISLIVKGSLDGNMFSLVPGPGLPSWKHDTTFSALAFVLASKQDTRFTHHVSSSAVLAFENGTQDRGGNLYIYRGALPKDVWAKQVVLKIADGPAGSLLGVGLVEKNILLGLCDEELVVVHGFM